jgi:hypothetical protein
MKVKSRFVKKRIGNIDAMVVSDYALLAALREVFPKRYKHGFLKKHKGIIEA